MTDEEINIEILEYCGWVKYKPTAEIISSGRAKYPHWTPPSDSKQWVKNWGILEMMSPPCYTTDLNAMRKALQTLISTEQQNQYINNIAEVCWADESRSNNQVVFNQLTASARQQAEAFVRTINKNKWKERYE